MAARAGHPCLSALCVCFPRGRKGRGGFRIPPKVMHDIKGTQQWLQITCLEMQDAPLAVWGATPHMPAAGRHSREALLTLLAKHTSSQAQGHNMAHTGDVRRAGVRAWTEWTPPERRPRRPRRRYLAGAEGR